MNIDRYRDILALAARTYPNRDLAVAINLATRDYCDDPSLTDADLNHIATATHDYFLSIAF